MTLAIFDLDGTLLEGDSATLWGEHMVKHNLVADAEYFRKENERFDTDYKNGCLDTLSYFAFILKPMLAMHPDDLLAFNHQFVEEVIRPCIRPVGLERIDFHKEQGDTVMIATSTIDALAIPVAHLCGVEHVIATRLELVGGHLTGDIIGEPAYGEGKVALIEEWIQENNESWKDSYAYSDSDVDIPLLSRAMHAVAVNPNKNLEKKANEKEWEIADFSI